MELLSHIPVNKRYRYGLRVLTHCIREDASHGDPNESAPGSPREEAGDEQPTGNTQAIGPRRQQEVDDSKESDSERAVGI